jgi:REP element-mobilizing transposase RayT
MGQDKTQGIAPTLGSIIGAFRSVTTHACIRGVKTRDWPPFDGRLWQRNHYEHIIRHTRSHRQIAEYIATHPLRWEQDALRV